MAVGWTQAAGYLKAMLRAQQPSIGLQALQDPELRSCFLPDVDDLTCREQRVLEHLCEGLNNAAIAQKMTITINTVKVHLARIFRKTRVNNRTQAIALWGQSQAASY